MTVWHRARKEGTFWKVSSHRRHFWPQVMDIAKKHLILAIIIGLLLSGIPVITLCSSYCASSDRDFDTAMDGSCPFAFHSFVQINLLLSALFVLPFAGFFIVRERQFIPPGVYWPLFRPPRFSHWIKTPNTSHLKNLMLSQTAWNFHKLPYFYIFRFWCI